MALSDPMSDMLTRIRNASRAGQKTVSFPASKLKREVCRILVENRFIEKFVIVHDGRQNVIKALLKYTGKESVIRGIQRVSRPGRRLYVPSDSLPRVLNGLGLAVVTTSKGVLTSQEAKKQKVGGEVLCKVW